MQKITPLQYYAEFHPDAAITQPWNTFSSFCFFLPVIFWLIALRGMYKKYWVLIAIMPLALINGVGSSLWHAYSGGQLYLMLDTRPPRIMMGFLGAYFCRLLFGNWLVGAAAFAFWAWGMDTFRENARSYIDVGWVTFNYIFRSMIVIVPVLILMIYYRGKGGKWVLLTLASLLLAVYFRYQDSHPPDFLPMGTHFLWHVFCAAAYIPLGYFLIALEDERRRRKRSRIKTADPANP
ncbi:MAG TPA: hypothetical protein DCE41_24510 [Cytophagales bacterium]|nr:hypothetical protein [Cytophagales bacterium]HAA21455.1 hypothetical protein [Cytophagales bacterium]HAP65236.1 hypothetical protein [Cytophagales bacterium]